jgi:hypothetical protein
LLHAPATVRGILRGAHLGFYGPNGKERDENLGKIKISYISSCFSFGKRSLLSVGLRKFNGGIL